MTAVFLAEERISLADLAEREHVHISTVARWCQRGIKGHRLESFSVGWRKFTTVPAYLRWLAAINGETAAAGGAA